MKYFSSTFSLFIWVISAIVALAAWSQLDFSSWIDGFIHGANAQERFANLVWWVNVAFKFLLTVVIFGTCLLCTNEGQKSFSYEQLADEIFKERNKKIKIELIGYSLGFANPIKLRLEENPWKDLEVTIFTMKAATILENFAEQKSLEHRVQVISERLDEWRALFSERKLGSLSVEEVSELMPFAAVVIGEDRLFVSNYKWTTDDGRLTLNKVAAPKRLFFEISNVDGAYETVMAVIKTFRRHVG
ncbi:hypothetical protein [Hoeflea sp.]|uniref:hypothetical protein n=1 Tax=Hoeflea sp. TaxID=1940281 RepID=UPI0019B2D804|nr:hypothetical protein [Hoeflea sp.]MBC7283168.1 hypothetical protein [Hoeflea sp.]